jgi:hypothetical protein
MRELQFWLTGSCFFISRTQPLQNARAGLSRVPLRPSLTSGRASARLACRLQKMMNAAPLRG